MRPLRIYLPCVWVLLSACLVDSFLPVLRCVRMPQRAFELADCRNPSVSFLAQPGKSNGVSSYVSRGRAFFVSPESDIGLSEDLESLQALFNKYCDNDGLMSKDAVIRVPFFAELLTDGDVRPDEFDEIWSRAPKFPDDGAPEERVDVDSFVQIYRDVDDLFEDETDPPTTPSADDKAQEAADEDDPAMEAELEAIFATICDKDNLLSFESLREWDEVQKLLEDGFLGEDELEDLWARTKKAPGSTDQLDVDGFLSFNIELDGLFEFDDEDMEEDDADNDAEPLELDDQPRGLVEGDLPVPVLFSALMGEDEKVGMEDLMYWGELKDMMDSGDLLESELKSLFAEAGKGGQRLDEKQFNFLVKAIDDLFEEEGDDEIAETDARAGTNSSEAALLKQELLETLRRFEDPDLLPCGLDFYEKEQKEILSIVDDLESQPTNLIRQKGSGIEISDVSGSWELIFTSSSAMRFNKGLSGLGGSFPNGRFAGLKQTLKADTYLRDVEYQERIEVNPSSASFDVKVTGTWDLQTSTSLFTGQPSVVLTVVPDMVSYGITSMRGDHWKSLGPTNMLDISYLDEDLRIMRGNTAVENIFIYRRTRA